MKISITGSIGNISKPLAEILLPAGHEVTIISSDANKKSAIEALGAKAAIGSIADIDFLVDSFKGADAVYTMIPHNFNVTDYLQFVGEVGNNYAKAIQTAGIKRVVNLSSIGAHLASGTGLITGHYGVEQTLNRLENVSVKHLRPGFFYNNFFFDLALIKSQNIMGSNYGKETKLVMAYTKDIAEVAAYELQSSFTGKSYNYVVSDERNITDIVKILGTAIGKPELPWVQFTNEQALAGMTSSGMSPAYANLYIELGEAIDKGILWEDYDQIKPGIVGKTKLDYFAKEAFAPLYRSL